MDDTTQPRDEPSAPDRLEKLSGADPAEAAAEAETLAAELEALLTKTQGDEDADAAAS